MYSVYIILIVWFICLQNTKFKNFSKYCGENADVHPEDCHVYYRIVPSLVTDYPELSYGLSRA